MRDFTLQTYSRLLLALQKAGYQFYTLEHYYQQRANGFGQTRFVLLRHDVDLHAERSLATARIEAELGIRASYYFRVVPQSNQPTMIKAIADLGSSNTLVLATTTLFNVSSLRAYRYDMIVNLVRLNDIRGINKIFAAANDKLPDQGHFICCFETKSTRKKRFLKKFPPIINWLLYTGDFMVKRILPKLYLTNRLYYDITQGKNRVLSNTEVLGRLYFCGFEVLEERLVGNLTFVLTRRKQQPDKQLKKRYGPLIKLRRIGKNKKQFNVYKMRTMHPYAEFLQAYMFEKNSLQEGGKIANDIRVTTVGKFMRKYWLDEVPMFINVLRGDMKLVGVRPLSNHYFNLYTKELQEKRTKFRPGLLPPFYADMPKTLDEIQASEMRYLELCEKRGCLITDTMYAWKIFVNIVFKKARSH